MGCVSSKVDINDTHPNIFHVMNVDENYVAISPGEIEITETELIFHQRHKQPTKWSLRNLRKYGFDSDIFSFECGRRCVTGPGVFAFRCRRAELLFNLLQQNIQLRNMTISQEENMLAELNASMPIVHHRSVAPPEGYLNPVNSSNSTINSRTMSRPGSITSNGPLSPNSVSFKERNNNKRASLEHPYLNTGGDNEEFAMAYVNIPANLDLVVPAAQSEASHLYMNVSINEQTANEQTANEQTANEQTAHKQTTNKQAANERIAKESEVKILQSSDEEDPPSRIYANIDTLTQNRDSHIFPMSTACLDLVPQPIPSSENEVNYIELDLVPSNSNSCNNNNINNQGPAPESPKGKSYVTIDFHKTIALKESVNPRLELEDGSRKTRHNSTISDVRNCSSVSD